MVMYSSKKRTTNRYLKSYAFPLVELLEAT